MWVLVGRSHAIILTAQYVKSGSGGEQGWPAALAANVPWLLESVKYYDCKTSHLRERT